MESEIGNPIEYNPTLDPLNQDKIEEEHQEPQQPYYMDYPPPPPPPPDTVAHIGLEPFHFKYSFSLAPVPLRIFN